MWSVSLIHSWQQATFTQSGRYGCGWVTDDNSWGALDCGEWRIKGNHIGCRYKGAPSPLPSLPFLFPPSPHPSVFLVYSMFFLAMLKHRWKSVFPLEESEHSRSQHAFSIYLACQRCKKSGTSEWVMEMVMATPQGCHSMFSMQNFWKILTFIRNVLGIKFNLISLYLMYYFAFR